MFRIYEAEVKGSVEYVMHPYLSGKLPGGVVGEKTPKHSSLMSNGSSPEKKFFTFITNTFIKITNLLKNPKKTSRKILLSA